MKRVIFVFNVAMTFLKRQRSMPTRSSFETAMSAPRVRIAILGASPFTREAHVPAVIACGHLYEIVAVYNR